MVDLVHLLVLVRPIYHDCAPKVKLGLDPVARLEPDERDVILDVQVALRKRFFIHRTAQIDFLLPVFFKLWEENRKGLSIEHLLEHASAHFKTFRKHGDDGIG